jgi:hypothetical protein
MSDQGQDYYRQCRATRLIFAFVLRQRLDRMREREGSDGLSAVDADKTMRLTDRLWAQRPSIRGSSRGRKVRFLPVDRDIYGKHGHRPGFETGRAENIAALDVLLAYDRVVTAPRRLLSVNEVSTRWGAVPLYESQVSAAHLRHLVKDGDLDDDDIAFLQTLGSALGELTEDQIRAVGRHDGPDETANALMWELDRWSHATAVAFATLATLNALSTPDELRDAGHTAWASISYAYENILKAGIGGDVHPSDREAYASGVQVLKAAKCGQEVQSCCACLCPPEEIWEAARVRDLQLAAFSSWTISLCILRLRSLREFAETELAQRFESVTDARLDRALDDLARLGGLDSELQPARFSYSAFMRIPIRTVVDVWRPNPTLNDLAAWIDPLQKISLDIENRVIKPKVTSQRSQPV